jgi:aspartate/methionine/tyrosine aminotransferase
MAGEAADGHRPSDFGQHTFDPARASPTPKCRQPPSHGGFELFSESRGGYYVYLRLPDGVDDIEIARQGAKEGIFIAPGSVFCVDRENPSARGIRINVSRADDDRFYDLLLRRLS